MLPSEILKGLTKVDSSDFIDLLNYYYTAWLFVFMCALTSAKQYFGSPIQCMVPADWRSDWAQYARDYCFVTNTFHVDTKQKTDTSDQQYIGYYQWVPLIFAFEALAFYAPSLLLRALGHLKYGRTFVRFTYLVNITAQLAIMALIMGFVWPTEDDFPLVTLCEVSRRQVGQDSHATSEIMQCVLAINMLNHKLFLVLWIWLVVLFGVTLVWFVLLVK